MKVCPIASGPQPVHADPEPRPEHPYSSASRGCREVVGQSPYASWRARSCSAWKRCEMAFFSSGSRSAMERPGVSSGQNSGS